MPKNGSVSSKANKTKDTKKLVELAEIELQAVEEASPQIKQLVQQESQAVPQPILDRLYPPEYANLFVAPTMSLLELIKDADWKDFRMIDVVTVYKTENSDVVLVRNIRGDEWKIGKQTLIENYIYHRTNPDGSKRYSAAGTARAFRYTGEPTIAVIDDIPFVVNNEQMVVHYNQTDKYAFVPVAAFLRDYIPMKKVENNV